MSLSNIFLKYISLSDIFLQYISTSDIFPRIRHQVFSPSIPIRHFSQYSHQIFSPRIPIRHFPQYSQQTFLPVSPSDISPSIPIRFSPHYIPNIPPAMGAIVLVKVSQLLWQWNIITVTILLLSLRQPNTTTATALPWKGMYSKGHYTLSFSLCSLIWQFKKHIFCKKKRLLLLRIRLLFYVHFIQISAR